MVRKTECIYGPPRPTATTRALSAAPGETHEQLGQAATAPSESRRLLELELIHQWSTYTYETLATIPEEIALYRDLVIKLGLKHPFLLNGILACASLRRIEEQI